MVYDECMIVKLHVECRSPNTTVGNDNIMAVDLWFGQKLQRNLSRKMAHREIERKFDDKDGLSPSSSPRAAQAINKQEKSLPNTTNSINNNNLPQHQITIKTSDKKSILPEGRWGRRWSFKRSPPSWFYDPKKILLFFATMSSMGTMLLIYFTLSINKRGMKGVVLDWQ
ncbi:uncharacterized protein LOC141593015 isoform X3 [Silene latifolia]|uniref:uncharacterized protein LOC141593015 isoform X3 n=1 Tax=Silene latifolia TaxID=37657 RepID=UPI003D780637